MPGRASSRRSPAPRPRPPCGPSCARRARTTRPSCGGCSSTGSMSPGRATAAAASSPSACASTRTGGSPPTPSRSCAGRRGRSPRSRPRRPDRSSPARARCTASCTHRARPAWTAVAWRPRCGRRPRPAGSSSWPARCTASWRAVVSAAARRRARGGRARDVACAAVAVAGGAWTGAVGEWLGANLPVGPTKGQIVHLGVDGDTGSWPIVQPLLTHYLVPWPGGRVACGGTFEAGAGFSVDVTAAGLHELLRECLTVAPGLEAASYLETRVGLRPTSADDRAVVGRVPGLGQRLGGHRPRRQRPAPGAVLGPRAGAHRGGGGAAGGRGAAARRRSTPAASPEHPPGRRPGAVRLGPCCKGPCARAATTRRQRRRTCSPRWPGRTSSGSTSTTRRRTARSASCWAPTSGSTISPSQSAERFNQRPRVDIYDNFVYLVARGADPDHTGDAEVHCFWTDRYVVTVHRGECPTLAHTRDRLERHPVAQVASPQLVIVYLVIGSLVDSFFPVLSEFDDKIDALEDDILKTPTEAQLGELFEMKRSLIEHAQDRGPRARHGRQHQRRRHRHTRHERRGDALLPRPLRPPDPGGGHGRQLPGPALERHGHAPVDGVEPPQRGDEAADHHRHDLPAA